MAALLVAGAAFTACSSSENDIENGQPEAKQYTLTIEADKGGFVAPAGTRATANYNSTEGELKFNWDYNDLVKTSYKQDEIVYDFYDLRAQSSGESTILSSGTNYESLLKGTELTLKYGKDLDLSGTDQSGTLEGTNGIVDCYTAEAKVKVTSEYYASNIRTSKAVFVAKYAVVKFNLPHAVSNLRVNVNGENYKAAMASSTSEVWMLIPGFENQTVTLYEGTDSDSINTEIKQKTGVTMKNGEFWEITVE